METPEEDKLFNKLHSLELIIVKDFAALTVSHEDLKKEFRQTRDAVHEVEKRISSGQERFSDLERRIGLVEIDIKTKEADIKAKMWQVISWVAPAALLGGLLAWGTMKGG